MYARILIPVDFGECSDRAIAFAKRLSANGAVLRLVYVLDEQSLLPAAGLLDVEELARTAGEQLDKLGSEVGAGPQHVETCLRRGPVYREILDEAEDWDPEIIVLGSHGRRGLRRFLLGSVAERVARDATQAVCIVKGEPRHAGAIEHVAMATDFSKEARNAQKHFHKLLRDYGARGSVLHVFGEEAWLGDSLVSAASVAENLERLRQMRGEELDELIEAMRDEDLRVEGQVLAGTPWEQLSAFANENEVDVLVIGTHGYRGVDRFVLGSVAEKTLRAADQPVLVVPSA